MASAPAYIPPPPLEGAARTWGTIALSAATFMNVLDTSIANVSLPAIAGDLGVSPNQGTWVITSFAVANAIAVPLTGWLSQRFGQVRLFVASVLLFVLASWLCGLAPNMATLIAFRALQGFVAGPMIPLSQSLLLSSYPRALAGTAMAMWSMTTLVAPVMGPLLGGWITDNIAWPWIFYINIPVGIASAGAAWMLYRHRESAIRKLPIDAVGLALLVVWVSAMQVMLDIGKENDWFHSAEVVTLAVVAVVGFLAFLAWELTEEHPVVDLTLFQRRNFWAGAVALSVAYGVFFGNVVLLPLWLQQFMGYTATQAGMVMAPVGLLALVLSPVVGKNIGRVDPRYFATFAFLIFALCCGCAPCSTPRPTLPPSWCPPSSRVWPWRSSSSRWSPSRCPAYRRSGYRRRPACPTSCGLRPVPWALRWPPPCGRTVPPCTTPSWWSPSRWVIPWPAAPCRG